MKKAPLQVLFLLFCQQNIMVDRPIKTCLKGFPFYSGAKKPHGFCHCRLQRHVKRLHHRKTFLDGFAHLINLHITAFMRHLSRHNDLLSLSAPVVHRLLKTLFSIGRQSAYTKGFNNDCIGDELGWISNESQVKNAMKYIWSKTGVQPVIYLKEYDPSLGIFEMSKTEEDAFLTGDSDSGGWLDDWFESQEEAEKFVEEAKNA